MAPNHLFAIDPETEEVIVSASPEGSQSIQFIERIGRQDNEVLYHAVLTLTGMASASPVDVPLFQEMDRICQAIYLNHNKS